MQNDLYRLSTLKGGTIFPTSLMLDFQKGQYGKRRQGLFGGGVWQTLPQPGAHDGTGGHELCCQEAPLIECDGSVSSGFCFAGGGAVTHLQGWLGVCRGRALLQASGFQASTFSSLLLCFGTHCCFALSPWCDGQWSRGSLNLKECRGKSWKLEIQKLGEGLCPYTPPATLADE